MNPSAPPKTYRVKSFGCQMNVYDGERMAELLGERGIQPAPEGEEADLVILNTCHIREKAAEKVYSELGKIRKMKTARAAEGGEMLIAVAGCVAQAEGEEIVRRAPAVDLVFGPQTYHRLPQLLARQAKGEKAIVETAFPAEEKFEGLKAREPGKAVAAFLTVQEGCDKFCTFCVVPYTRGAEFSRPVDQVLGEARLAPNGSWTGSGRLDAATARRVAETMAEVTAAEFPTRDLGAGDWRYELRVTDQAAAGAGGAAETLRTYLLAAPSGAHNLLMRDEADTDSFLLAPGRADILIPLLDAGK